MIKKTFLTLSTIAVLSASAHATALVLSGGRSGPAVADSGGNVVSGGLVRVGFLNANPAGTLIKDVALVFEEFGSGVTQANGKPPAEVGNADAGDFNGQQIYIWAFNADSEGAATEHGLFTLEGDPATGDAWTFPVHTGTGSDSATISLGSLVDGGTAAYGELFGAGNSGQLRTAIGIIPEPSGALLAGLAGALLVFRRRRS